MLEKNELPETIPASTVKLVREDQRLFPGVVIELAEAQVEQNPSLDKIEVMRNLRDELNARIGHFELEMIE